MLNIAKFHIHIQINKQRRINSLFRFGLLDECHCCRFKTVLACAFDTILNKSNYYTIFIRKPMSENSNLSTKIAKAGSPFKFFGKKESTSPSLSTTSKLIPATPKMRISDFSLKAPVTPTLTDASLKGEQKRTGILEAQLKEVSLTASKAYDQIEDLTLRNNMLDDQVLQQKQLIESFTQQLEDAFKEKQQFKSFQDETLKQKLVEKSQDSDTITKLKSNNTMLNSEVEELKKQIQQYQQIITEKDVYIENIQNQHQKEIQNNNIEIQKFQSNIQNVTPPKSSHFNESLQSEYKDKEKNMFSNNNLEVVSQYKNIINTQQQRILELENELQSRTKEFETSLVEIKSTVLVLNNNKQFLNKQGYRNFSTNEQFSNMSAVSDKGDGDTFILSNLSFLP